MQLILIILLILLLIYFIFQAIRCNREVQKNIERIKEYDAKSIELSYGRMNCVDKGTGPTLLSSHSLFGGYDQAYEVAKNLSDKHRIIAPSRFGYLGSNVKGGGTPSE